MAQVQKRNCSSNESVDPILNQYSDNCFITVSSKNCFVGLKKFVCCFNKIFISLIKFCVPAKLFRCIFLSESFFLSSSFTVHYFLFRNKMSLKWSCQFPTGWDFMEARLLEVQENCWLFATVIMIFIFRKSLKCHWSTFGKLIRREKRLQHSENGLVESTKFWFVQPQNLLIIRTTK